MIRSLLLAASVTAALAQAQSATKPLEFEVVSIKPADPDARGSSLNLGAGDTLTTSNLPLRTLITFAYDIRDLQLTGGPNWVNTERYDVTAKTPRDEVSSQVDPRSMTDEQRKTRADRTRE